MISARDAHPHLYHDMPTALPEHVTSPELVEVHDLSQTIAPEGASRYVRTKVHEVLRPNGDTGYQVVNELAPGVSLAAVDVVNGHGYLVMVDQLRYPHVDPRLGSIGLEAAAKSGQIGRWSREIISGGASPDETLKQAVIREAAEEAGLFDVREDQIKRMYPTMYPAIGINNQPFNLFGAKLEDGQFQPELAFPDLEEGTVHIGAYRLDTLEDMVQNGDIFEMSAVMAIGGLWRLPEVRPYLPYPARIEAE